MPYEFFEHEADIGIRGIGSSLEESFEEAAKALFDVMTNIKNVAFVKSIEIACEADNVEELFVEWLNKLLSESTVNDMLFSKFMVKIENNRLTGTAKGETLDTKKHELKTEVKAATYSQLKVSESNGKFVAQCIVDV